MRMFWGPTRQVQRGNLFIHSFAHGFLDSVCDSSTSSFGVGGWGGVTSIYWEISCPRTWVIGNHLAVLGPWHYQPLL